MIRRKNKYPIVEVEWHDAEESGEVGWNSTKEMLKLARKQCPTMKSVGYLVHESKTHVALLSTINDDSCSTLEKIPRGMVLKLTPLSAAISPATATQSPLTQ